MRRLLILSAALLPLAGCTSLDKPSIARDFQETRFRATQALAGDKQAFTRLAALQARWERRGDQGTLYRLTPWDRENRDRAAEIAAYTGRVVGARDAIIAQLELEELMLNAVKDLESEYDGMLELLAENESEGALPSYALTANQKYLTRRMANSLLQMSDADMGNSVEAADQFGRDVARFQLLLDASLNGDDELGVEPPSNPDVEDSLGQIEELFTSYIADSSSDMLEYVVARYDAWRALVELSAMGEPVSLAGAGGAAAAAAATATATADAERGNASAAEDDSAEDGVGGEEGNVAADGDDAAEPGGDEDADTDADKELSGDTDSGAPAEDDSKGDDDADADSAPVVPATSAGASKAPAPAAAPAASSGKPRATNHRR